MVTATAGCKQRSCQLLLSSTVTMDGWTDRSPPPSPLLARGRAPSRDPKTACSPAATQANSCPLGLELLLPFPSLAEEVRVRLMPATYKHRGCKEHFSKPHGADHSQHLLIQFAMTNPNVLLLRLLKILAPPLRVSLLRVDNARLAAPQPAAAAAK